MKINNFSAYKPVPYNNYKNNKCKKTDKVAFKQSLEVAGNFLPELVAQLMAAQKKPKTIVEFKKLSFDFLNILSDLAENNPKMLTEILQTYYELIQQSSYGKNVLEGHMVIRLENVLTDVLLATDKEKAFFPKKGLRAEKFVWLT